MLKKRRRKNGFTLIELLVVVAIIAVLIAILLPALSKARQTAGRVACASNLNDISRAITMYLQDNSDFLPLVAFRYAGGYTGHYYGYPISEYGGPKIPDGFIYTLKNYTGKNEKIFLCPADKNIWYAGSQFTEGPGSSKLILSYQYNEMSGWPPLPPGVYSGTSIVKLKGRQEGKVACPSKAMLLADKDAFWGGLTFGFTGHGPAGDGPNGGNFLFVDGHTEFHSGYDIVGWYGGPWYLYKPYWAED